MLEGNDYPNWQVGEEIVIAPSGWNPEEAEIRTITSYDSSSGMRHTAADCTGNSLYTQLLICIPGLFMKKWYSLRLFF